MLVVAIVGAGAIGYPYYKWLVKDDVPRETPRVAATTAPPTPVLAAIAVAPEPVPPPSSSSPQAKSESASPVDVATAIPPPPPPAAPVSLPAPTGTAASQPETALSWTEIVEVQKRLASLGINPGPIDGVAGPRTATSVQAYETRIGHAVTGKVDRSLLALLRQDPDTSPTLQARAP